MDDEMKKPVPLSEFEGIVIDADGTAFELTRSVGMVYAEICVRHGLTVSASEIEAELPSVWTEFRSIYLNEAEFYRTDAERDSWVWREFASRLIRRYGTPKDFELLYEEIYEWFAR